MFGVINIMYYDDEIERKPTKFGDAIMGDPDDNQVNQVVSAIQNEEFNKKLQERIKDKPRDLQKGLPYIVGTYVICVENGKLQADRISDYIITPEGDFVVLDLNITSSQRVSERIKLSDFMEKWFPYETVQALMLEYMTAFGVSYQEFCKEHKVEVTSDSSSTDLCTESDGKSPRTRSSNKQ